MKEINVQTVMPKSSVVLKEAFMMSCLAAQPVAFTPTYTNLAAEGVSFAHLLKIEGRVLFVNGESVWAEIFQKRGMKAFEMHIKRDVKPSTTFEVYGELGHVPFAKSTFQAVFWMAIGMSAGHMSFGWLRNVAAVVQPGGYLLFDEDSHIQWPGWLEAWRWERVPFHFGYLSVYRKPMTPRAIGTSA
jgi:hypothetical protein